MVTPTVAVTTAQDKNLRVFAAPVLEGEIAGDRIEAAAPRYINRVIARAASSFGPRSLDEEIGEDGFKLGDLIVDPVAEMAILEAAERGWAARAAA